MARDISYYSTQLIGFRFRLDVVYAKHTTQKFRRFRCSRWRDCIFGMAFGVNWDVLTFLLLSSFPRLFSAFPPDPLTFQPPAAPTFIAFDTLHCKRKYKYPPAFVDSVCIYFWHSISMITYSPPRSKSEERREWCWSFIFILILIHTYLKKSELILVPNSNTSYT